MHQQRHFSFLFSSFFSLFQLPVCLVSKPFSNYVCVLPTTDNIMVITIKINFYCSMIQALKSLCFVWVLNFEWRMFVGIKNKKGINSLLWIELKSIVIMGYKLFFCNFRMTAKWRKWKWKKYICSSLIKINISLNRSLWDDMWQMYTITSRTMQVIRHN